MSAESVREMRRMMNYFDVVVEARKKFPGGKERRPPLVVLDATESHP